MQTIKGTDFLEHEGYPMPKPPIMSTKIKRLLFLLTVVIIAVSIGAHRYYHDVVNSQMNIGNRGVEHNIIRIYERFIDESAHFSSDGYIFYSQEDGVPLNWVTRMFLVGEISIEPTYIFVFTPGTTRAEIEAVIGLEDRRLPRVVREGHTQLIVTQHFYWYWGTRHERVRRIYPPGTHVKVNIHANTSFIFDFGDFGESNYIRISMREPHRVRMFRCEEVDKIVVQLIENTTN